jgi:hypothetical protein
VTVVFPDLLGSCDEVAVTVTGVVDDTAGAVNRPEEEIVPALAVHVTPELKFPVPVTTAEHWLVWPDWMVEGEQVTVTEAIVEVDPPPPLLEPQATVRTRLPNTNSNPIVRT